MTVFSIIEIPCLSSNSAIFARRAELRSLRSLRYLSVDGIFHNRDTLPSYYFFYLLEEHSSARFARSASYRLTVSFIIEMPGLVINCSNFAGRAELRSLRSFRYLVVDNFFVIEIPSLPITFRSSPDDQSSARFARSATYRRPVCFIICIPILTINSPSAPVLPASASPAPARPRPRPRSRPGPGIPGPG